MAKLSIEELIAAFKELSLVEVSEFVKAFEEEFDVTAAAPVAVVAGGAGGGDAAEEKSEFDVILESAGDKKIAVIKEVRALTSLGLKEAKELVDGAPKPVLEGANKEAAEKAKEQLDIFLDTGGTLLDTAASYGEGVREEVIGALLREHVDRQDLVIGSRRGGGGPCGPRGSPRS